MTTGWRRQWFFVPIWRYKPPNTLRHKLAFSSVSTNPTFLSIEPGTGPLNWLIITGKRNISLRSVRPTTEPRSICQTGILKKDAHMSISSHHNSSRLLTYLLAVMSHNNYKEDIISIIHVRKGRFGQVSCILAPITQLVKRKVRILISPTNPWTCIPSPLHINALLLQEENKVQHNYAHALRDWRQTVLLPRGSTTPIPCVTSLECDSDSAILCDHRTS